MGIEKLKTAEDRKARKPLLERKRRARINDSLSELKVIVLRSLNKDSSRYTKMEKADILEMAVKHLKDLRETVSGFSSTDGASRYRDGFNQCASEVTRYVSTMDSMDHNARSHILSHLNTCCQSVNMSVSHATNSPPLSPLVPSHSASDLPQGDRCYHFYATQPMSPLLAHALRRHEQTGKEVTHLTRTPGYCTRTKQHMNNTFAFARDTSATTKDLSRPETVWRPW